MRQGRLLFGTKRKAGLETSPDLDLSTKKLFVFLVGVNL